jgi:two-component system OmpR family response regulator
LSRAPEAIDRSQRSSSSSDADRFESGPVPRRRDAARSQQQARVLIVEPVASLRTLITRAFAERGHSVTAVGTLDELRRLMRSFEPHVVVCELSLPDGTGDNACRRIKASGARLQPVVLMSSLPEHELQRRAVHAGADRFHPKSRALIELIEAVEQIASEIVF